VSNPVLSFLGPPRESSEFRPSAKDAVIDDFGGGFWPTPAAERAFRKLVGAGAQ
jgi:hypothetical protein